MQTTAYFTVPIRRLEERGVVDPPPVAGRRQAGLLSTMVPVAVLIAATTSAWLLWQTHEPAVAAARDPVIVTLAEAIPAADSPPEASAAIATAVEPAIASEIEVALEVEPAAGLATLARGEVLRQRPGAVPAQEETMRPMLPAAWDLADTAAVEHLIQRGDAFLLSGDIVSARLVYERAAAAGNPQAMIALAQSYDPALLRKLGARGIRPEPEQAQRWYAKATEVNAPRW